MLCLSLRAIWITDETHFSERVMKFDKSCSPLPQLVPRMCDAAGGRVSAAHLQRGQLPGPEQRVRQQQILYRPQVSISCRYRWKESQHNRQWVYKTRFF